MRRWGRPAFTAAIMLLACPCAAQNADRLENEGKLPNGTFASKVDAATAVHRDLFGDSEMWLTW
jgi:hypothetical protein